MTTTGMFRRHARVLTRAFRVGVRVRRLAEQKRSTKLAGVAFARSVKSLRAGALSFSN